MKHEEKIIKEIRESSNGLTTKELKKLVGLSRDATYGICSALVAAGKLGMEKKKIDGKIQNIYKTPEMKEEDEIEEGIAEGVDKLMDERNKLNLSFTPAYSVKDYEKMWNELKDKLIKTMAESGMFTMIGISIALNLMVEMEKEEINEP